MNVIGYGRGSYLEDDWPKEIQYDLTKRFYSQLPDARWLGFLWDDECDFNKSLIERPLGSKIIEMANADLLFVAAKLRFCISDPTQCDLLRGVCHSTGMSMHFLDGSMTFGFPNGETLCTAISIAHGMITDSMAEHRKEKSIILKETQAIAARRKPLKNHKLRQNFRPS